MTGPHGIWDDREPSDVKRARVRRRLTLADLSALVGYSVAQVHRLEVHGRGSIDLRRRVGQILGIKISAPVVLGGQLVLLSGSSRSS